MEREFIKALDTLARFGFRTNQPKIESSAAYLLSRRLPDGSWPLDESPCRSPLNFGAPGEPNPWLTLDALAALKRLGVPDVLKIL